MLDFETDVQAACACIKNGGILLYPTDTVWGIGCSAYDAAAIDRIYQLKQRPVNKSMLVLIAEAKDILQYVAAPPPDIISMLTLMEEPTTVVYNGALGFPDNLVNEDGSIAIRVVNEPFCKALIKRLKMPVVSTSANLSGQPTSGLFKDIDPVIKNGVDYVVSYRQDDSTIRSPSRIIKLDDDGNIERIR